MNTEERRGEEQQIQQFSLLLADSNSVFSKNDFVVVVVVCMCKVWVLCVRPSVDPVRSLVGFLFRFVTIIVHMVDHKCGLTMTVFEQYIFTGFASRVVLGHRAGQKPLRAGAHACRLSLVHLAFSIGQEEKEKKEFNTHPCHTSFQEIKTREKTAQNTSRMARTTKSETGGPLFLLQLVRKLKKSRTSHEF